MNQTKTAAEQRHHDRIAELGCIVCLLSLHIEDTPAEVHHVRVRHGWGRSGHMAVVPLCAFHHRHGRFAIHNCGAEVFEREHGFSEVELLRLVNVRLGIEPDDEAW